jgi:hypothetical protein
MSKYEAPNLYRTAIPFQRADLSSRHHREKGRPMADHKFAVGQTLFFSPSIFEPIKPMGHYCVVRLLPADGGDPQYRLKSETDGHERVVRESQLALG